MILIIYLFFNVILQLYICQHRTRFFMLAAKNSESWSQPILDIRFHFFGVVKFDSTNDSFREPNKKKSNETRSELSGWLAEPSSLIFHVSFSATLINPLIFIRTIYTNILLEQSESKF